MGSAVQWIVIVILAISCSLLEASLIRVGGRAACPPNDSCAKKCDFGFMKDDNNCELCACKPNPKAVNCPAIQCPNRCDNGYQQDEIGCTLCECKSNASTDSTSSQTCGPICLMYCQYGNKLDNDGCPICECKTKEETCGTRRCRNYCPGGAYKQDDRGCDTCECQSPSGSSSRRGGSSDRRRGGRRGGRRGRSSTWPSKKRCNNEQIQCAMYCPSGFKRDEHGCEICECRESVGGHQSNSRIIVSSSGVGTSGERHDRSDQATRGPKISCPSRRCKHRCSHGYVKDTFGCDTCNCNSRSRNRGTRPDPQTSPPKLCPTCRIHCEHGFVEKPDGCFECKCKPAPAATPPPTCITCRMYCEHGFKQRADGCYDCVCNDPPQ